jgi:hypothetical protein
MSTPFESTLSPGVRFVSPAGISMSVLHREAAPGIPCREGLVPSQAHNLALAGSNPAPAPILPSPQCSSGGRSQSEPFLTRAAKVMESAGHTSQQGCAAQSNVECPRTIPGMDAATPFSPATAGESLEQGEAASASTPHRNTLGADSRSAGNGHPVHQDLAATAGETASTPHPRPAVQTVTPTGPGESVSARAGVVQLGLRSVCSYCGKDLPGSDATAKRVSHGMCSPLCDRAREMGWGDRGIAESTWSNFQERLAARRGDLS